MLAAMLGAHILAAVYWVGGMAFAYLVLRPAAAPLDPQARLPLWRGVFSRFLLWVGLAIVVLLATGFAMIEMAFGGMAGAPVHVHVMMTTGIVMMLVYLHMFFSPWRRFRNAVDSGDMQEAAARLGQIRTIVAINLVLGVVTVLAGATGRYW